MIFLILSILALFTGFIVFFNKQRSFKIFDIIIIISVCFLIFFLILPEMFSLIGWRSVPVFFIGAVIPLLSEHFKKFFSFTKVTINFLIILSFSLHSFFDGGAIPFLLTQKDSSIYPVLLLLVIHRVPVGLFVCRVYKDNVKKAVSVIFLLAFISIFGYFIGNKISHELPELYLGYFNSFVAGLMLHVVFHKFHTKH